MQPNPSHYPHVPLSFQILVACILLHFTSFSSVVAHAAKDGELCSTGQSLTMYASEELKTREARVLAGSTLRVERAGPRVTKVSLDDKTIGYVATALLDETCWYSDAHGSGDAYAPNLNTYAPKAEAKITVVEPPPTPAVEEITPPPPPEPPPVEAKPEPKRFMIAPVKIEGVDEGLAQTVADQLASVVSSNPDFSVMTEKDLVTLMEGEMQKQAMGCEEDLKCMAEISKWTEIDRVLQASLGQVGESYSLSLSLINSAEAKVLERAQETFRSLDDLPKSVELLVKKVLGLEGHGDVITYRLQEGEEISIAVLNLNSAGVSESISKNLTQVTSVELKRLKGATVISSDDIVAMLSLEEDKQMLGCDDASCLAEIGGALGVDKLVNGQVGLLGNSYMITLKLISPGTAQVENRVSETFVGDEATLIPAVRSAARKLFGIESKEPGNLSITSAQMGAKVNLNGEDLGEIPLPPIEKLLPGRHTLRVDLDGYLSWVGDVYVNPMDTTPHWVELKEAPQKWYQKWWVWTVAGVALAGTATAISIAAGGGSNTVDVGVNIQ